MRLYMLDVSMLVLLDAGKEKTYSSPKVIKVMLYSTEHEISSASLKKNAEK